eukprot:GHVR01016324.1.p1 GENE.GHVR01016324.1~~GHVR01016324.1.p1  ORF type:complete len:181 (+),score=31.68 GHVR01016324.1:157-699(+)
MRPLTEEETKAVFEKFSKYIGHNLVHLVDRKDEPHIFRLHKERVVYLSERLAKMSGHIPRKDLISAGIILGKFSKNKKFRIQITSLNILHRYAKYKLWVKAAGEQSYLYGNNIIRRHLGRISENTPNNIGVVVLSMNDIPLGFGQTAKSTTDMRSAGTEAVVLYHQSDIGEYLRDESNLL